MEGRVISKDSVFFRQKIKKLVAREDSFGAEISRTAAE